MIRHLEYCGRTINITKFLQMFHYIRELLEKLDRKRIPRSGDDQISGIMMFI